MLAHTRWMSQVKKTSEYHMHEDLSIGTTDRTMNLQNYGTNLGKIICSSKSNGVTELYIYIYYMKVTLKGKYVTCKFDKP